MIDQNVVDEFAAKLKLVYGSLSIKDFGSVVSLAVEHAEDLKNVLSGPDREEFVIEVVCRVIDATDTPWLPDSLTDPIMKGLVRAMLPGIIDSLCKASKGLLRLNTKS